MDFSMSPRDQRYRSEHISPTPLLQDINPFVTEWEEAGAYPAHQVTIIIIP